MKNTLRSTTLIIVLATTLVAQLCFPAASNAAPIASNGSKMIGINGTYTNDPYIDDAQKLGVQWMRIEQWNDSATYGQVTDVLTKLTAHDIRMLPLVNNYSYGWRSQADKDAWVAAIVHTATTYGAGGSWWHGKTDLGSPVIEVGNEVYGAWYPWPGQSYLYPDQYALMLKQAAIAVNSATGGKVKLIASVITDYNDTNDLSGGSGGTWKHWDTVMKSAVPDITSYLGGVAVHPYGDIPAVDIGTSTDSNWSHQVLYTVHNRWSTLPVYVTEEGQKGPLVGYDKQAAAMDYYFNELRANSWEAGMFWYDQKDFQPYDPNGDNGWALIDSNDTREPAWYRYQADAAAQEATGSGDVNGDGTVNLIDLSVLLSHWNQAYTPADFDKNGVVNNADVQILLSNYTGS